MDAPPIDSHSDGCRVVVELFEWKYIRAVGGACDWPELTFKLATLRIHIAKVATRNESNKQKESF